MTNNDYSDYLAEHIDKSIDFAEYLAAHIDTSINYADYLSEHIGYEVDNKLEIRLKKITKIKQQMKK